MVYKITILPEARQDISSIFNYILTEYSDPITATNVIEAIESRIDSLKFFPRGVKYDKRYYFALVKRYKILYFISSDKIYVARVVHGLRKSVAQK